MGGHPGRLPQRPGQHCLQCVGHHAVPRACRAAGRARMWREGAAWEVGVAAGQPGAIATRHGVIGGRLGWTPPPHASSTMPGQLAGPHLGCSGGGRLHSAAAWRPPGRLAGLVGPGPFRTCQDCAAVDVGWAYARGRMLPQGCLASSGPLLPSPPPRPGGQGEVRPIRGQARRAGPEGFGQRGGGRVRAPTWP